MNQKSGAARHLSAHSFTEKQGQYLAFIYTYAHMFRRPPAEADMQPHFQVSPPSVHQMIVTLERNGLIRRQPGVARSIQVLVDPKDLPILDWLKINQSKSLCRGTSHAKPPVHTVGLSLAVSSITGRECRGHNQFPAR